MTHRHALIVRVTHWIGATAILCMILSGLAIYNAAPSLPVMVPRWITLGGWLGGGIAWHLTAMWVLLADGLVYLGYGLISGHFRRDFWPLTPSSFLRDLRDALTFKLQHDLTRYNAVQKAFYIGVLTAITLAVLTGLSIWKPVQFHPLTALFGGYPVARGIHLAAMAAISLFLLVHLSLVLLVPETIIAMITGRAETEPHA